jgi:hypothetical protein
MSKVIRAHIELAPEAAINSILRVDAQAMSKDIKSYIAANQINYYVVCNSWLLAIKQWSEYGWINVFDAIKRDGLINTIKRFSSSSDELVHGTDITDALCRNIYKDVQRDFALRHVPVNWDKNIGFNAMATALFLFRFPKRLSPKGNDLIQQKSIKDFLAVENRTKLLQRSGYPQYMLSRARVVMDTLDWDSIMSLVREIMPQDIMITSGVGFDAKASLGSKLVAICKSNPEYFGAPFGVPYSGAYPSVETEWYGENEHTDYKYEVRTVAVRAVPKSYKASRIIAMESTYRQAYAKRVFSIIDRFLPESINLHDQGQNQHLAEVGSIDGSLATLDLSNASDCISKSLIIQLFRNDVADLLLSLVATHYEIDGKVRLLHQFSTAGNSLTFVIESLVFWAIATASTQCQATLVSGNPGIVSIYGDDIIVSDEWAEGVIDWLEALGFIVNTDKSFYGSNNLYRESCGVEYLEGTDVSSLYYPRFPIEGEFVKGVCHLGNWYYHDEYLGTFTDSTSSLIDLQHKLYQVCYPAAMLIKELVKESHPKMTTSVEGSLNGDLWDYDDTRQKRYAPAASIEVRKVAGCVVPEGSISYRHPFTGEWRIVVLTPIKIEGFSRDYKYRMRTDRVLTKPVTDQQRRLLDLYNYYRFLKYGPKHFDDCIVTIRDLVSGTSREVTLSELNHTYDRSSISVSDAYGQLKISWGFSEALD